MLSYYEGKEEGFRKWPRSCRHLLWIFSPLYLLIFILCFIGEPLRSIDSSCGDASVSRTDHPSTQPDASPSTASHSGDDTKALKEAVENIQKLFSIHLLQQENGDNEDSTDEDGEQPNQSGGSG